MTALIVIGIVLVCLLAYLAIGAVYARQTLVWNYRRLLAKQDTSHKDLAEKWAMRDAHEGILGRVLFWPVMIPTDLMRTPVRSWLEQPIAERRADAARLRAEADQYEALIASCEDRTDRDLMRKGQAALRAQAAEVDL